MKEFSPISNSVSESEGMLSPIKGYVEYTSLKGHKNISTTFFSMTFSVHGTDQVCSEKKRYMALALTIMYGPAQFETEIELPTKMDA